MSHSQPDADMSPPPQLLDGTHVSKTSFPSVISPNELIEAGILEEIPANYHPDQFCMAMSTQILRGVPDLGTALLRVNSRGHWEPFGGFLEMYDLGHALEGHRSTEFPTLMQALRDQHATGSVADEACQSLGLTFDGTLHAIGIARPTFGALVLGSVTPFTLSPSAIKLIAAVTETWLSRGEFFRTQTAAVPQVDSGNSEVIFTERQRQVLALLADGLTNTEIGRKLSISASLAKQEVAFISHALQAKNRLDAVVQAQRQGILPVGRG